MGSSPVGVTKMEETARFNRVVSFENNTKFPVTYRWPHGQAVKTPPFHGDNMGSSPVGVTSNNLNRTFSREFPIPLKGNPRKASAINCLARTLWVRPTEAHSKKGEH